VNLPRLRDISIKRKLTLIIMLTTIIALLLSCVAMIGYDWILTKQALTRRIDTFAEIVGSNSTAALIFDRADDAAETLKALSIEPHIVSAWVFSRDGTPFARYRRSGESSGPPELLVDGARFGDAHLTLFRGIYLDEDRIGTVFIEADLRELHNRAQRYAGIVLLFVVVSAMVAFAVGSRLRDLISVPILHLADTMRAVTQDEAYSIRAEKQSEDEIGVLIDGFNAMLDQIHDRDTALQRARDELALRAQELQGELSERKRIEAQITASLREKEVLLKEIHHRVKNNLQVISSLLDLQVSHIEDERAVEMLRDSQNRVTSMGLIHERLYQADDLAMIDIAEYVRDLVSNLLYSYSVDAARITLDIDVEDVVLDVDRAIPRGLIINELVSNSLKYAFAPGSDGRIVVALTRRGDSVVLTVQDDGIGLPESVQPDNTPSLGLRLVSTLAKQLRGSIELERTAGTSFTIQFAL
jgi:two-component sensor histidine kinase